MEVWCDKNPCNLDLGKVQALQGIVTKVSSLRHRHGMFGYCNRHSSASFRQNLRQICSARLMELRSPQLNLHVMHHWSYVGGTLEMPWLQLQISS